MTTLRLVSHHWLYMQPRGIGIWGYTPVGITGVLVLFNLFLVVSTGAVDCLERLVSEMGHYASSVMSNPTHSVDGCDDETDFFVCAEELQKTSLVYRSRLRLKPMSRVETANGPIISGGSQSDSEFRFRIISVVARQGRF